MTQPKKMGRKPFEQQGKRRLKKISSYVTVDEESAVNHLGTDYQYAGISEAIRYAVAFLIRHKHPELLPKLRDDLRGNK